MPLQAAVYVAPPIPFISTAASDAVWSPISCTLIYGDTEAVLVDVPITPAQTNALADWIEATIPGKYLSTVYITHGHGDHWFGLSTLKKRFPGISAYATEGSLKHALEDIEPKAFRRSWARFFPGQIDENFELPKLLPSGDKIYLEGHLLQAVEVGHSDTRDTTVLWVPDLKLVVAGDVVYGNVHQMLAEARTPALQAEWIAAIEKIENLKPVFVVPGHKRPGELDGVYHLAATKKYIQDFMRLSRRSKDAGELFSRMMELYPNRFNPVVLRWGTLGAFKTTARL